MCLQRTEVGFLIAGMGRNSIVSGRGQVSVGLVCATEKCPERFWVSLIDI